MRLAISSIVFVAAFALVGCEKKVEAPAVADAGVPEKPACCEPTAPAADADAAAPVAPLSAPVAPAAAAPLVAPATSAATVPTVAPVPAVAPVAAPTTTIKK